MKNLLCFIFLFVLIINCNTSDTPNLQVFIDEDYNALFTRTNGWTGGDVAHSIPLSDSSTLWIFGDSWIGPVKDRRHYNSTMISNVIAIQHSKDTYSDNLTFYYKEIDGKPAPFISPSDGNGVFWFTDGGIKTSKGLFLFASQVIKKEDDESIFGFETIGKFIVHVKYPFDEPNNWKWNIKKMPYLYKSSEGYELSFGSPQFISNGYIYIYGYEMNIENFERFMILARVAEDKITDFDTWEFFYNRKWHKESTKVTRLCNHFGAEYSVSYQPSLKKYVTIYTENGMSDNIMLRTAAKPEGPWSEPLIVYRAPEVKWDKEYFCYAAKGHPELSNGSNDLLVSYICNSFNFSKMVEDTRIYRPKFIRIRFADNNY